MANTISVSVIRGEDVVDFNGTPGRILPASAAVKKNLVVANIVDVLAASAISVNSDSPATGTVIKYNTGRTTLDELTVTEGTAAVITAINA